MKRTGYLLVLPVLAALGVVEAYPIGYSIYLSVTNYSDSSFVGLSNYWQMLTSGYFFPALGTSILYATGSVVLSVVLGVLLAFQLFQLQRLRGFFQSLFLVPLAMAPIVVGVIWAPAGIWDDFNTFWHFVLGQPYFNPASYGFFFPVMVLSDVYEWSPLIMLVALGIMVGVRPEVYEAAKVHGASTWQIFRRVIVPSVARSPAMQFVLLIRFIDAMRAFEIPFAWSTWVSYPDAGSPVDTVSLLIFKLITGPIYGFPIGLISAMAVTLLVVTLVLTGALFRLMNRSAKV